MHKWPRAIWKVLHSKEKVIKRGYVYKVRLFHCHFSTRLCKSNSKNREQSKQ